MSETKEIRLKRLRMRAWHRGTKEMDVITGTFADTAMTGLSADDLDAFETLMGEADPDILAWITGARTAPDEHAPMVDRLRDVMLKTNQSASS